MVWALLGAGKLRKTRGQFEHCKQKGRHLEVVLAVALSKVHCRRVGIGAAGRQRAMRRRDRTSKGMF